MAEQYKLYLNGDYSNPYEITSNWSIQEQSGSKTLSTFDVLVSEGQAIPRAGDSVEVKNDVKTIFFGVCENPKSPKYSSGTELKIYSLNCNNANSILARRIPNITYANTNLGDIVNDLFTSYIQGEGFTLGEISQMPEPVFKIYNSNALDLQVVLNELAGYVNATWTITNDRKFYFLIRDDFEKVAIDKNNGIFTALQKSESSRDLRTRQIIEGGTANTDPITLIALYEDKADPSDPSIQIKTSSITLRFPLADVPKIYVSGVLCQDVAIKGANADDTPYLFLWQYNSDVIAINNRYTGSVVLVDNTTITIEYVGTYYIRVETSNSETQSEIARKTGTSGIIENYANDTTIKSVEDAQAKADGLLLTFGEQKKTLTLELNSEMANEYGFNLANCELFKEWEFDLPSIDLQGESYVLTEKQVRPFVLDNPESLRFTLKFTNRDFVETYGQTISRLYKDTNNLSVREGQRIIKYNSIVETLALAEELQFSGVFVNYVYETADLCFTMHEPLGSGAPYLCF